MKTRILASALLVALGTGLSVGIAAQDGGQFETVSQDLADEKGCLSCHEGIEDIRESTSAMLAQIKGMGSVQGDPGGCVVCHGGAPGATSKDAARDRHLAPAGRLAHTALAILTLEVYYRLLPIYTEEAVE